MSGDKDGAIKTAAKRLRLSEEEYRRLIAEGNKWCIGCSEWHKRDAFGGDSSRTDGLASKCRESTKRISKASYVPKEKIERTGYT